MASTTQYVLTRSPIYVSGSNVGIGTTLPVYTFQVNGDIAGTRLCIGSDCRDQWPSGGGGIAGSGSSGQVTFWTDATSVGGDNNLFWDNLNKRLGIGTTIPQTSLHVIGNITADTFLGTINAANVSSGQFGANTGGGNYSFPGNVGIGTTGPGAKLHIYDPSYASTVIFEGLDTYGNYGFLNFKKRGANVYWHIKGVTEGGVDKYQIYYSPNGTNWYLGQEIQANQNVYFPGNVGIGTTAPGAKLDVSGDIKFSGALMPNGDPGINGQVLMSQGANNPPVWSSLSVSLPPGSIIMYSGPWYFDSTGLGVGPLTGWALCNGNNGTPDLSDRFVMGTTASSTLKSIGGANSYTLSVSQLPPHSHTISWDGSHQHTISGDGAHSHRVWGPVLTVMANLTSGSYQIPCCQWDWSGPGTVTTEGYHNHGGATGWAGLHNHGGATGYTGNGAPIDNRPAFIRLAFIMKL
jgi:hypothetical protein